VPLADVVRWMSAAPAALVGLEGKGAIAVGNDADLVVFAPDAALRGDPAPLHHRHPGTPYAGRELTGGVRDVRLRGERVVTDGEPSGPPTGRLLRKDTR
jgi:allantoinase